MARSYGRGFYDTASEYCPDDTICYVCSKQLPEDPADCEPGSLTDEGFCSKDCKQVYEQMCTKYNRESEERNKP